MTKSIIAIAILLSSTSALADGFTCYTQDHDVKITMVNHHNPHAGTRKGALMVISDQADAGGEKQVIRFQSEDKSLTTEETTWIGVVPQGDNKIDHDLIGTNLNHIDTFVVDAYHNYAYPVPEGSKLYGQLSVIKTDKSVQREDLDCFRNLKN